mmetsp:Transcript_13774/g.48633  ORF Transcript_13774/g.48633 Transcript_13774/m.48633 type:complete len:108 (-) Transcript_13774:1087-1410(-)
MQASLAAIPLSRAGGGLGQVVRAGLFGVERENSHTVRLIVDRKRQNSLERPLRNVLFEHCLMPGVSAATILGSYRRMTCLRSFMFGEMFLPDVHRLIISSDNVADFH